MTGPKGSKGSVHIASSDGFVEILHPPRVVSLTLAWKGMFELVMKVLGVRVLVPVLVLVVGVAFVSCAAL